MTPRRIGLAEGSYLALMAPLPGLVAPAAAADLHSSIAQVVAGTACAWGGSFAGSLAWLSWSRRGGLSPSSRSVAVAFLISAAAVTTAGLSASFPLFWVALAVAGAAGPIVYPVQAGAVRRVADPSAFMGAVDAWVFRANAAVPVVAVLAADAGWWRAPFLGLAAAQAAVGLSFAVTPTPAEWGPPVPLRRLRRRNATKRAIRTQAALYLGLGAFWSALSPLLAERGIPLVVGAAISLVRWPAGNFTRRSAPIADFRAERSATRFSRIPVVGFVIAALAPLMPGGSLIVPLAIAVMVIEAGSGAANVASRRLVAGSSASLLMVSVGRSVGSALGGVAAAQLAWWTACAIGAAGALAAAFVVGRWRRRDVRHTLQARGGRVEFRISRTGGRAGPERRVECWSAGDYVRWELHEGGRAEVRWREDNLVLLAVDLTQEIFPLGRAGPRRLRLTRRRPQDVLLGGKRVARLRLKGDLPAEVQMQPEQLRDGTPAVRVVIESAEIEDCRVVALQPVA